MIENLADATPFEVDSELACLGCVSVSSLGKVLRHKPAQKPE